MSLQQPKKSKKAVLEKHPMDRSDKEGAESLHVFKSIVMMYRAKMMKIVSLS